MYESSLKKMLVLLLVMTGWLIAQNYNGNGKALVPDFQVNDNTGHSKQFNSAVAADNNGDFVVVWEDQRNESNLFTEYMQSYGGDIFLQRINANGSPLGSAVRVNDDGGTYGQHLPVVAATGNGNFVVAWCDERDTRIDQDITNIYAQRFDANGIPLGSNFIVNDTTVDSRISAWDKVAVGADGFGNSVIAWMQAIGDTGRIRIYAQRFSANGSALGVNFIIDNVPGGEDNHSPNIAMQANGDFVVAWSGDYLADRHPDIYGRRFTANGTPLGNSFIVDDYSIEEVYVQSPRTDIDDNGNFLIAWKDSRHGIYNVVLYGQWYDTGGNALGSNFRINEDNTWVEPYSEYFSIAVNGDGSFGAAWNSNNSILKTRRFSGDSTAIGNSFSVTMEPNIMRPPTDPAMAINSAGQILVSWTDARRYSNWGYDNIYADIYAQRIEGDSTRLASDFLIGDDEGSGGQLNQDITTDGAGNFTVVWEDPQNDAADVYLQRFNSAGVAQASQRRVNSDAFGEKNARPAVATDANGLTMVVWELVDNTGNDDNIYGQFFAADGTPLDTNFSINNGLQALALQKPQAAAIGNGLFVITWQISLYNIGAQIYSFDNGPVGNSFYVEDTPGDWQLRYDPVVAADDSGNFVICWQQSGQITAQVFDQSGLRIGPNITLGIGIGPAVAARPDGNFYVVWGANGIKMQRVSQNGSLVGANVAITDPPPMYTLHQNPDISFDASGKFIIVWESVDYTNNTSTIMGHRLSTAGTFIGDAFYLTGSITNHLWRPKVSVQNNRIYNCWNENQQDGTSWNIYANVLDFDNPNTTDVENKNVVATNFELQQNYPNPFNPQTIIRYQIPRAGNVKLTVFNLIGQKVATLVNSLHESGEHTVTFNAGEMASGLYFYRLETQDKSQTRRMLLLK